MNHSGDIGFILCLIWSNIATTGQVYFCSFTTPAYASVCLLISFIFSWQHIPYQFATEYLPNCKVKILLHNLKGKTWTVNSIPTTRVQTSHTFCGGWLSFVRENNIDLGDICIFELVRECELRVRVLRVEREGNGYSSKAVHEGLAADYAKISGSKSRKVGANSNHCSQQVVKAMKYDKKGSNHDKGHHGNMLKNHQLHCQSKISSGDSGNLNVN